jgi:hypothetical protein
MSAPMTASTSVFCAADRRAGSLQSGQSTLIHKDGQLVSLQGYSYGAVETKGKSFTTGLKIEPKGTTVRITAPKATAAWIDEVRARGA